MSSARASTNVAPALRRGIERRARALDAIVLTGWSAVLFPVCWLLRAPWWLVNLLLLTLPATYLLARSPLARRGVHPWFVVKYALFVSVFFNYLCVRYSAWAGPSDFPPLPGGVLVEQVTWCALMIVLVVAVHERFSARPSAAPTVRWSRTVLSCFFFAGFVVALVPPLHAPLRDHVYLKVGLILYPVIFAVALRVDPRAMRSLLTTGAVFVAFDLAFELLALHNGYWRFPGRYVGWVTVAGSRFPIEELAFMVVLLGPAIAMTNTVYLNWKGLGRR
ncbi:MAG TPA: hypothetical protein VFF79_10850 [Conexibacter sp.]|jgi:hypothetical protein|nr:hypothetical protein [Conexibacter sp.]